MKRLASSLLFAFLCIASFAQNHSATLKFMFNSALENRVAYNQLKWLCENTEGRICGTPEAAAAVEFTYQEMLKMDLDTVYLQKVMVKNWKRGEPEQAFIYADILGGKKEVPVSALGLSIGTGMDGLFAPIVEVDGFESLKKLGRENIEGKIVFFNRPMDPKLISTFSAYGGAANQRTLGPAEAAKYGALGVVVRSLTLAHDDFPHTGVTQYQDGVEKIPAVMISTNGADLLSETLKKCPGLKFYFKTNCKSYPDVLSYNVIGEIKGTTKPDEIITVGGHLDAWDNSQGAHDDGGGCVQSIEVLRLFKELGLKPKHTLRAVMFMDEEVAQRGGLKYAEEAMAKGEKHVLAVELDRGVLVPRGVAFSVYDSDDSYHQEMKSLFKPYGIDVMAGGGGVDIGPLRNYYPEIVFGAMIPDNQRYFDFHHCGNDTFDQVNFRELQLGAAATAALIYLWDAEY